MSFDSIMSSTALVLGILTFLGIDQQLRGWNLERNVARLEKQRAYYVELAASESARGRLIYPSLLALMALLFAYLMLLAIAGPGAGSKLPQTLQWCVGVLGYLFACATLGRLNTIRVIDKYLERVDKKLAKLHSKLHP